MRYTWDVAGRYLLRRGKEQFISLVGIISILGVATGVATLIVVIGVMTGFDRELRDRIVGTSSHIVIEQLGGMDDPAGVQSAIRELKHVMASAPFVHTQALVVDDRQMNAVMVRGIDPAQERFVSELTQFLSAGSYELPADGIIVGRDLARRLMLATGDTVQLVSMGNIIGQEFTITGIFSSGMHDFDTGVVFLNLAAAQTMAGAQQLISGISVRLDDVYAADEVKKTIQDQLGFPFICRSWMDLNRNLFEALKLEKTAMFVILTLIILVASLNIAGTLIMMVMEKTKDIGILKALGADRRAIAGIFTLVGAGIGTVGTALGVLGGIALAYVLKTYRFIQLPRDIYYIDTLPVDVTGADIGWIVAAALIISLLATLYPAGQAARLNPVEALRYE